MNKITSLLVMLLLTFSVSAQSQKAVRKSDFFKYPVLVKLVEGNGNVFRIGFLRYNDFYGKEENPNEPQNIYADFIDLADVTLGNFKDKRFVYFPLSKGNGEMLIINKGDITKLDMTYEQAMKLILVERDN